MENSCADKAFFCNSGAEANEAAIKCARKHANDRGITDPVIITAKQSFHGRTLATITATGQPKYQEGFTYGGEMVRGFQYVEYNNMEELQAMVDEMNVTPEEDAKAGRSVACLFCLFVMRVEMMRYVSFRFGGWWWCCSANAYSINFLSSWKHFLYVWKIKKTRSCCHHDGSTPG